MNKKRETRVRYFGNEPIDDIEKINDSIRAS